MANTEGNGGHMKKPAALHRFAALLLLLGLSALSFSAGSALQVIIDEIGRASCRERV